jgi:hypothetical protein
VDGEAAPAEPAGPAVRVVRGTATAEEVAALLGVLLSRRPPAGLSGYAVPQAPATPQAPSLWRASARPGSAPRPGPGAWRASALLG